MSEKDGDEDVNDVDDIVKTKNNNMSFHSIPAKYLRDLMHYLLLNPLANVRDA